MALVAVLVIALASGGGDGGNERDGGSATADSASGSGEGAVGGAEAGSGGEGESEGSGGSGATPGTEGGDGGEGSAPEGGSTPAGADPSTPTGAVQSLYTRAAADDFDGAWSLGTKRLHAQFGGSIDEFRGTFSTLESITFPSIELADQSGDEAKVDFSTVARHTDRTDRCTARASLTRQGGNWLVDHLDQVDCQGS
jgi:hypothetical protein